MAFQLASVLKVFSHPCSGLLSCELVQDIPCKPVAFPAFLRSVERRAEAHPSRSHLPARREEIAI